METLRGLIFTELQLPTWQLALYTVLSCVFILTRRMKSFLLTTCLFALFWTFYLLRAQWLAVIGGDILGPAVYGLFSLILVGISLHAFISFREGEPLPGFGSYEINRLRRSLLKRIDQMESAILQAEEKAIHEIRQFEEITQRLEAGSVPRENQVQESDTDLLIRQTALADLEARLRGRIHDLEGELAAKEEMLRSRDRELETVRSEAEEATQRLRLQLQEAQERGSGLETSAQRADEEFNATVRELERQLVEREALLLARNKEIKDLHAEAREMTEAFNKESQALKAEWNERESSLRERERKLVEELSGRQEELRRQQAELRDRDRVIEELKSEMEKEVSDPRRSAAEENAATLQILLREQEESFARRTASYQEVVDSLTGRIQELERQIKEQEMGLSSRSKEKGKGRARTLQPKERSGNPAIDPA